MEVQVGVSMEGEYEFGRSVIMEVEEVVASG